MGIERQHGMIVFAWNNEQMNLAHALAKKLFRVVGDLLPSPMNGHTSFLIPSSGSKVGWPQEVAHNKLIQEFKKLVGQFHLVCWIDLFYGSELGDNGMIAHSGITDYPQGNGS